MTARVLARLARLDTALVARFQEASPFEPVDHVRLERLRAALQREQRVEQAGAGQVTRRLDVRRRRAQIAARHALRTVADGLRARQPGVGQPVTSGQRSGSTTIRLPESWLPFAVGR